MSNSSFIKDKVASSIALKQQVMASEQLIAVTDSVADAINACFKRDGKVLFCGNGGSAADAQHLAAEFSGRFYYDRPPLFAEALHVNTSYVTAVANDYSYDEVYARLTRAMGRKGDVLIGLSTSGNSANVVKAFEAAREIGMTTVGMTGQTGGNMAALSDFLINIPSTDTPRIQECHMLLGHTICELVEMAQFPKA